MPNALTFRFAGPEDAARLYEFFKSISEATIKLYKPHPFDEATATARCNVSMDDKDLSIIAVDESGEVLGYCVYLRGFWEKDLVRNGYHVRAYSPDEIITVAPCVKEGTRSGGIGGMLMRFAAYQARLEGRKALVLCGGVRADNVRAFRTYQKSGFRILDWWEDPNAPVNYDMAWDLVRSDKK